MKTRVTTIGLLLSLAWTCCAAGHVGSIPIQNQTLHKGIAYITYPVVVGARAASLNPVIQHWIGSNCDSPAIEEPPDESHAGVTGCLAAMAGYCASPENGGNAPDSTCQDNITAEVGMNSDGFLVVELDHTSHANMEPHGNWLVEYLNLDASNGRILNLSDLLTSQFEPTLDQLLVRALQKQWDVPAGKTLMQFGMLTDDPGIPRQFAIGPTGLLFTYQVDDVGPRAFGDMQVLIPYTDLSRLIQKKGPLARLIGRGSAQGSGGSSGASSPSKGSRQASISSS